MLRWPKRKSWFMRVYYLTGAQFALSNLALRRIKIARFEDLNDLFRNFLFGSPQSHIIDRWMVSGIIYFCNSSIGKKCSELPKICLEPSPFGSSIAEKSSSIQQMHLSIWCFRNPVLLNSHGGHQVFPLRWIRVNDEHTDGPDQTRKVRDGRETSRNVSRFEVRPACIAGVRTSGPNFRER